MPFLSASAIVKAYATPRGKLDVLRGMDLAVESGEMVAIVGASGVGKSTLLHVLGGLDALDAGTLEIGGARIDTMDDEARVAFRNQRVGFVFQFHHLLPEFSALENVEMPLLIGGVPAAARRARAAALIERVGLTGRLDHLPGALSGGEQQRVAIARALVTEPALLLADEPTGNLDEDTARDIQALIRDMHAERRLTSIIVTHNPVVAAGCDRVLRLQSGLVQPV
ncbi:MAG: ABC transporter ATP-binding protein [Acidobacteria bacterium]|nr:MAG: ABC transporter ATP-binding protein [Acidobacteriota bacterium]